MSTARTLTLFLSTPSERCRALLEFIRRNKIQGITNVFLDTKTARDWAANGAHYRITSVPTLVVSDASGMGSIYVGYEKITKLLAPAVGSGAGGRSHGSGAVYYPEELENPGVGGQQRDDRDNPKNGRPAGNKNPNEDEMARMPPSHRDFHSGHRTEGDEHTEGTSFRKALVIDSYDGRSYPSQRSNPAKGGGYPSARGDRDSRGYRNSADDFQGRGRESQTTARPKYVPDICGPDGQPKRADERPSRDGRGDRSRSAPPKKSAPTRKPSRIDSREGAGFLRSKRDEVVSEDDESDGDESRSPSPPPKARKSAAKKAAPKPRRKILSKKDEVDLGSDSDVSSDGQLVPKKSARSKKPLPPKKSSREEKSRSDPKKKSSSSTVSRSETPAFPREKSKPRTSMRDIHEKAKAMETEMKKSRGYEEEDVAGKF